MPPKPNILLIITTQWRAQAFGYACDPNARTPWLDRLAGESVNFTQAVTPHPFGPFARAAMLTGVPAPENGVRDYFDPLPVNARTVAHELAELGYATAFFGKWHLSRRDPGAPLVGEAHARAIVPVEQRGGFAHWEGFESGFLLNDPWLHGSKLGAPQPFPGYQSDVVCGRVARYLSRAQPSNAASAAADNNDARRPWFVVLSLEAPHPPYHAPASGIAKRKPAEMVLSANVPLGGDVEATARSELAGYYAHGEATDRAVGRLVESVGAEARRRGEPGPIVVFTSVHGDMHGAHGLFRKGWPHEESVRVPLLVCSVAADGAARRGHSDSALVSLLDLRPWTVACANAGTVAAFPRQATQRMSMPSVVRLPHQCDRIWRGVRTAARKLVLNEDGSPWLLFDLSRDPLEQNNLAADPAWRAEIDRLRAT
jgi:arylsulfatase A-like enzyme